VLAYLARRAVDQGAILAVVADAPTGLEQRARMTLRLDEFAQVEGVAQSAVRPVVLHAAGLNAGIYGAMRAWPQTVRFLPLIKGTNGAGAAKIGITPKAVHGDALYLLAGDDVPRGQALPKAAFTVVHAAYHTEWTEGADVVLPAQVWTEKNGHITNVEGVELAVVSATTPPKGIPADDVALGMLAVRVGQPQGADVRVPAA